MTVDPAEFLRPLHFLLSRIVRGGSLRIRCDDTRHTSLYILHTMISRFSRLPNNGADAVERSSYPMVTRQCRGIERGNSNHRLSPLDLVVSPVAEARFRIGKLPCFSTVPSSSRMNRQAHCRLHLPELSSG